jgi:hypothetical protein
LKWKNRGWSKQKRRNKIMNFFIFYYETYLTLKF